MTIFDKIRDKNFSPQDLLELLDASQEAYDINEEDSLCVTPLIESIVVNRLDIANILILKGADLLIQSYPYGTALVAAMYFERWDLIDILIKTEEDQQGLFDPSRHPSLLYWAIVKDRRDFVEMCVRVSRKLENYKLDILTVDTLGDDFVAPEGHNSALFRMDCPFIPRKYLEIEDLPLNIAVSSANEAMIRLLLFLGADPNLKGLNSQNAYVVGGFVYNDQNQRMSDVLAEIVREPREKMDIFPVPNYLLITYLEQIERDFEYVLNALEDDSGLRAKILELLHPKSRYAFDFNLSYVVRRMHQLHLDRNPLDRNPPQPLGNSLDILACMNSVAFLACCVNPDFFNDPLAKLLKEEVILKGCVDASGIDPKDEPARTSACIYVAQRFKEKVTGLIKDRLGDVAVSQAKIKERPQSSYAARAIWGQGVDELANLTPQAKRRSRLKVDLALKGLWLVKQGRFTRLGNLPQVFPKATAIEYLRDEWMKQGIYNALMANYERKMERNDSMSTENSPSKHASSLGEYPPGAKLISFVGKFAYQSSDGVKVTSEECEKTPEELVELLKSLRVT